MYTSVYTPSATSSCSAIGPIKAHEIGPPIYG